MRVVFLGTPWPAVPTLEAVLAAGHEITLVVSQPDRPAGRSGRAVIPPVKKAALERGLPVVQPAKVRTAEFLETIASTEPNVLVVVAYGRILPAPVLRCASRGAINVHFSLLPAYRGAAPVQWALANGERRTGVSTMRMNEAMDEGDILLQAEVDIEPEEHCPALQERLAPIGAALLVETLARLEEGALEPRPQEPFRASYAPILKKEDGNGDPSFEAKQIEGRVRGFDPWPGFWLRRGDTRVRIVRAKAASERSDEPPGKIFSFANETLWMACGGGSVLEIRTVQAEGRRPVDARDAVNGRLLVPGDRLEATGTAT